MKEAILFRGKHEILILPENSEKANKLYDFLNKLFEDNGFKLKIVGDKPDYSVIKKISKKTVYLIGHSRGANNILREFNPKKFQNVKGIILLDPLAYLKDKWDKISLPKILFASKWGQDYSGFDNLIKVKDDHYFNKSFKLIGKEINQFIK